MPKKKGKKKGKKKTQKNNNNNTGTLASVPVLLVPEIHMNPENMMRNKDVVMSYVVEKQRQGFTRICFVSEGNGVNPIFEMLISLVGSGERSATVDYIKKNLLVEALNNKQVMLQSGHTIHTLPTTMNPLVDFITHFFQDYGALTYQMGDPNTLEGFTEGMAEQGLNNVESWFGEGNTVMIQHLKESRKNGFLNEEGNAAAERIIAILQKFKDGGLQGFYGASGDGVIGENYVASIAILAELLESIKILIIDSTGDSFDENGKMLLPQFIKKIKDGLVTGIANPEEIDEDGLNAWQRWYLPNLSGKNEGKIKPFMKLINSARDNNILNAMKARLSKPNPPEVFVMIFGKGHFPSIKKKLKDDPHLVLDALSEVLFNSMSGGKKTRRRRKTNKKKKTKRKHKRRKRKSRRRK